MKQKAQALGLDTGLSNNTPIVPIIIGDSKVCMKLSHKLFIRGFNVLPIVHPAVEEERARLRFFVTAAHNEQQIDKTLLAITEELSLLQQDSLSTKTKDLV
jgi:7-keto-8-aminopelargonate synthetase-like enzyme